MSLNSLLAELKRRHVFRVAVGYAVAAWLVVQIADTTFPHLPLPAWSVTLVIVLVALGFPVALVLAWAFDITQEGVVRADAPEAGAPGGRVRKPASAGRIAVVGAVVILGLAGGAFTIFGGPPGDDPPLGVEQSIAVLPFANMSADEENEYFSDGVHEDIIASLSKIADLKVISRTSTLAYRGTTKRLREIGDELGVGTILEGSVRRDGNSVRITAQLIDARTDRSLWSETSDRQLTSIFQIQTEIAQQIAGALRVRLSAGERQRIGRVPTDNLEAYDLYLRARHLSHRLNQADNEAAIALFMQAVELDPGFAAAYAGLGRAYNVRSGYMAGVWSDSAVVLVDRAARLAPQDAEVLAAQGIVRYQVSGRVRESLEILRRAASLDPNSAIVMGALAASTSATGQLDEALRLALRGAALEPTTAIFPRLVGSLYGGLGMLEEAEEWYGRALAVQPDFIWARQSLALEYLRHGRIDKAAEQVRILEEIAPDVSYVLQARADLRLARGEIEAARDLYERAVAAHGTPNWAPAPERGYVLIKLGRREEGLRILSQSADRLRARLDASPESVSIRHRLIRTHAARGDGDEALRLLQEAIDHGVVDYMTLRRDPLMESLHGDARFQRIMAAAEARVAEMRRRVEREGLR